MAPIESALAAAATAAFTRPIPKSAQARMNFLTRQAKGDTAELARMLGVSRRQAQRYLKGDQKPPAARLERAVKERWQPRVRQRARQQAARRGVVVEIRARIGYSAPVGSSDDGRMRRITQALPPEYARQLVDARTEDERRRALEDGIGDMYFRDGGRRAPGLGISIQNLDYIGVDYL
jgi:transcriptional regulator with XRE-family HTH domain